MEKRVMMLIVGMVIIFGLPAMALCQEETAEVIEAAPTDTGPPFVETEVYEADMAVLQEQIETVVASAPIPITQADIPLTITTPGSYYLTEDVTSVGTAVTILADDVTIDLMGYTIKGPDSGINTGVSMTLRSNVEIRNGTVRDFRTGIYETSSSGHDHRVIDVRVVSNFISGICLNGYNHLVKGCTVSDSGYSSGFVYGIEVGEGSTVTSNRVYNNGTSADTGFVYGIEGGSGSTVTDNTVYNNGTLASDVYGIKVGESCTVTGNTSNNNGNSASGLVYGIGGGDGCTVTGNTACDNGGSASGDYVYGIYAGSGSTVTENTAHNNGSEATGYFVYGIYANTGSTVNSNTTRQNGYSAGRVTGIYAGTGSTVTGNTARDNGTEASGYYVYGIYANTGSKVCGNTASNNGDSAGSNVRGLYAGTGSTVTGNVACENGDSATGSVWGVWVGGYNLVDQNTAYNNYGVNMNSVSSCVYGINVAP